MKQEVMMLYEAVNNSINENKKGGTYKEKVYVPSDIPTQEFKDYMYYHAWELEREVNKCLKDTKVLVTANSYTKNKKREYKAYYSYALVSLEDFNKLTGAALQGKFGKEK